MSRSASPRLAPIPPEQWSKEARVALADAFSEDVAARLLSPEPGSMPMPNALSTLMHHPAVAGPFLEFNNVLLQTPTLEPRVRELAILRVAWQTRSHYEWLQHVRLAPRVGISADEIAAVVAGAGADGWSAFEADVIAATDQLMDHYRVEDDTWSRLAEQLDERQLVELVFVVGTYTALAMVFKSLGVQLDADLQELATTPFGTSLPTFEE